MNKKMLKIVIIAVIVVDLLLVGFVLVKKKIDNSVLDKDGMVYVPTVNSLVYYVGGGELGAYYRISLKDYNLAVDSLEGNGAEEISNNYEMTNEIYMSIGNIIDDYNLRNLGELPPAEIQVLDGETSSLDISLSDGVNIRLGDSYQMDDKTNEAMRKIVDILKEYAK